MRITVSIAFICITIVTSCNNEIKKTEPASANQWIWGQKNLSPKFNWLRNHKEYVSGHFRDSFFMYYQDFLKANQEDSCAYFIDWYSGQLNMLANYDTLMCYTQKDFISRYESSAKKNVRMEIPTVAYHLAAQYQFKGDLDSAIFWNNYVVQYPETDTGIKAFTMHNTGQLYISQGKLDKALPLFISAAGFHRLTNTPIPESMNYAMIAKTYCDLAAYDEAIKYYDLAINMMIKEGERPNQVNYYYDKIKMLKNNMNDTLAVVTTADSLAACLKPILARYLTKSKSYRFQIYTAQYYRYECLQIPDSSKLYFKKCTLLADSIKNNDLKNDYAILAAQHELKYDKKIKNENELVSITKSQVAANNFSAAGVLYGLLAENAKLNNPQAAINYFKAQKEIQDKRQALNNRGKLFELAEKYESEKKAKQIILQKEELTGKNKTIALLFAAMLVIILSAMAYHYRQSRRKISKEKQITEKYTRQLFEKTEEERKRIATDLHDSISHELIGLKNSTQQEFNLVNEKIDVIINDIRVISRNLHPVMFEKVGLQNTIEQMAERVQLQNNFLLTTDINYSTCLSKAAELQIYRIIQEAVTNLVKYSRAIAGKITISENKNQVQIEIKDNGKGFDVKTVLDSNRSFGLHNIIERSKAIGGEAKITSGENGTTITIKIPKIRS